MIGMSVACLKFNLDQLVRNSCLNRWLFKPSNRFKGNGMLSLAITLFILSVIAGILGFGGLAGGLTSIAQICFFVFIVLFLVSAVTSALRGRAPI